MNKLQPKVLGGIGQKKSNGGAQWYQQDRIYDNKIAISVTTSFNPYYLVGGNMLRGGKQLNETIEKNIDKFQKGNKMETVQEVLNVATEKIGKSFDTLKPQFAGLRTGKANPAMVDQIKVDYYGAPTPIKNLATISTPEPRQIKIAPFDPSTIDGIVKAILAANIGVTPQSDGKIVRITVPELNEERRKEIVKTAKTQAEAQKVAMRNVRRDANDAVKKLEKDKKISEDDMKQGLDKIQKATDDGIAMIDAELKAKEAEVMSV